MALSKEFNDGYDAFYMHLPNPYPFGSKEYLRFESGRDNAMMDEMMLDLYQPDDYE